MEVRLWLCPCPTSWTRMLVFKTLLVDSRLTLPSTPLTSMLSPIQVSREAPSPHTGFRELMPPFQSCLSRPLSWRKTSIIPACHAVPEIRFMYLQKLNCATLFPIHPFMYLHCYKTLRRIRPPWPDGAGPNSQGTGKWLPFIAREFAS
jgi:hypothetical protein